MSNSHTHHHDHDHTMPHVHPVTQNLKVAFFLNLTFTLIEFIGGWLTNSVAILLTVHLVMRENKKLSELASIRDSVNHVLKKHHIQHTTVQFEIPGEVCELAQH